MKYLILILALFLTAGAPSSTYRYVDGDTISADEVQTETDNIYRYLQAGVDTLADNSVTSAKITDATIATADIASSAITTALIADGTITTTDISSSASIPYSKLSFSNNIVTGDIANGTILNADINASAAIASSKLDTVAVAQGGTGATTAQTAIDALLPSQTGNSGKFLTTDATNSSWGTIVNSGNIVFSWYGVDIKHATYGIMTNESSYVPSVITEGYTFYVSANLAQTIIDTKFQKVAGIGQLTVYGKIWTNDAGGGRAGKCTVDINSGTSGNVTGTANQVTPEWKNFTIDVSGLTDGTVYQMEIQLGPDSITAGKSGFMSAIIIFGS